VLSGWASLILFAAVAEGSAAPGSSWLTVTNSRLDARCPRASVVAAAVEAELGQVPVATSPTGVSPVRCLLTRERAAWRADIEIQRDGATSERTIRVPGNDCRRLQPALILTLTLALAARPVPAQPPGPAPEPPRAKQERDPEMPAGLLARTGARPQPTWDFSGGAVVSSGGLPDLSAGVELGARWRRGSLLMGVEGRSEHARRAQRGQLALAGWRMAGAFVPCLARWAVGGCLVLRAGVLGVEGHGPSGSRSVLGVLGETGARATWQREIVGGLALGLHTELTVPLVRTRLLADGRPLWQSPAAVLSVGMAVLISR
jgi:hypothetical protein